jgi:hypothetical protein
LKNYTSRFMAKNAIALDHKRTYPSMLPEMDVGSTTTMVSMTITSMILSDLTRKHQ